MADAAYFRLAAHEAQALDPQTRLLLEASAEVPPAPPPPSPRVSRLAASYRSTTSIASDETTMRGAGPRGSISDQLPSQDGFLPSGEGIVSGPSQCGCHSYECQLTRVSDLLRCHLKRDSGTACNTLSLSFELWSLAIQACAVVLADVDAWRCRRWGLRAAAAAGGPARTSGACSRTTWPWCGRATAAPTAARS